MQSPGKSWNVSPKMTYEVKSQAYIIWHASKDLKIWTRGALLLKIWWNSVNWVIGIKRNEKEEGIDHKNSYTHK